MHLNCYYKQERPANTCTCVIRTKVFNTHNPKLMKLFSPAVLALFTLLFAYSACTEDDTDSSSTTGSVRFEITDAPIDDASVSAVFVTVTDIQVDGQSLQGFNKTTVNVLALQNGNTELLGNTDLEVGSYSDVTLVLDFEVDANGNSPGCYIQETGGTVKHKLESTSNELSLAADVLVEANQQATFVMDFDLRKTVTREDNQGDNYEFVSQSELEAGIRIVAESRTGVIAGSASDMISNSDKIVVYAYKRGEYNQNTEVSGQGQSNVEFANAVSSAQVDANGNYSIHFLEEGDYELNFLSYRENSAGEMELNGSLSVDVVGSLNLGAINVSAQSSTSVDVIVTGILPL